MNLYRSKSDVLEMLIKKGVELDSCTNSGLTALQMTVSTEFIASMRMLIENGCDDNLQVAYLIKFKFSLPFI